MKKIFSLMYLTKYELEDTTDYLKIDAVVDNICQRCGHYVQDVCKGCSELSEIKVNDYLYYQKSCSSNFNFKSCKYELKLTDLQQRCSEYICENNNTNLVWAVCGAGKTEITFNLILKHILMNHHICFAITRVDILYEIKERLIDYFEGVEIVVINGSEPKFVDAQIYCVTTNQLLRFKNAFELIIVDEVDAFPYEYDGKFDFAVHGALKDDAKLVYLTSTPSERLLNLKLDTFIINRRWHGYDLPVPIVKYYKFNINRLPFNLYKCLILKKRQQLIFVSNKKYAQKICDKLKVKFNVLYVHSESIDRKENIESFRNNLCDVLICTTILERGVTFKDIDVHVLDASSSLYTVSALVQIAGRVGRNANYQKGRVFFYANTRTSIIQKSVKQIKKMNKL